MPSFGRDGMSAARMIGIGKTWKALGGAKSEAPASTISRDVISRRSVKFEPLVIPDDVRPSETRSARRFLPSKTATVLTTKGGKRFAARIINLSRTGVAVEPETGDLQADDVVKVGEHPVAPGRRLAHGIVLVFRTPLAAEECGPGIVL